LSPYFKEVDKEYAKDFGDSLKETNTTLLLTSINARNPALAKLFIQKGADVNKPNSRGETPLLCAMRNRMHEFAKELVEMGAKLDARDIAGNTTLGYAIKAKQMDIALKALPQSDLSIMLATDVAQERNKIDENDIYAVKKTELVYTYLHLAAMYGEIEIAKKLLESGASADTLMDTKSLSLDALGIAVLKAQPEMVKLLIDSGADQYRVYKNSHAQGEMGLMYFGGGFREYTLLDLATMSAVENPKTLRYILAQKEAFRYVKLENVVFYKNVALALYTERSDSKTDKPFAELDAKLSEWDGKRYTDVRDEITALLASKEDNKKKVARKKESAQDKIYDVIERGDIAGLKRLQKEGINIAKELPNALFSAVIYNQKHLLEPPIEMGVDPNHEWTGSALPHSIILFVSNPKERVDIFKTLLQKGMNPNAHKSALLEYILGESTIDENLVSLMLSSGADFGSKSYEIALLFEDGYDKKLEFVLSDKRLQALLLKAIKKCGATEVALTILRSTDFGGRPKYIDGVEKLFEIAYKNDIYLEHEKVFELKKATTRLMRVAMFYMGYEEW